MSTSVKIVFLTAGDASQASTRFRVLQFLPYFEEAGGIEIVDVIALNSQIPYSQMVKRVVHLLRMAVVSDIVFIQKVRLPGFLTAGLGRLCKLVYDFDDAVFLPGPSWPEGRSFSRTRRYLEESLRHMHTVIAGNAHLAEYARSYCENVQIIPTVVDTGQIEIGASSRWSTRQVFEPGDKSGHSQHLSRPVVIGWIGGSAHTTQLDAIGGVLHKLQQKYGVQIKVVSGRDWKLPGLNVINKRWALEEEVADVQSFDIGLMPLDAGEPFLEGKCGFKAIEYMAVGIPVVASPVGVNTDIIHHGANGFLAESTEEWESHLESLIQDVGLREKLGRRGRNLAMQEFSIGSVISQYVDVFECLSSRPSVVHSEQID
jgi:glycosyltransferase involved in cell wall biosynthesis